MGQIGSLMDPAFVGVDPRLPSLNFGGKIYAPRHGSLPEKDYLYKIRNSSGQSIIQATIRPVELFVSHDSGETWEVATSNVIFTSSLIGSTKTQLEINSQISIMKALDSKYFVLTTEISFSTPGSSNITYRPIIFLFKEDIREGYYPVSLVTAFMPGEIGDNRISAIETHGKVTTFKLAKGEKVTLTFNYSSEYEWMFEDTFGGFQGKAKD